MHKEQPGGLVEKPVCRRKRRMHKRPPEREAFLNVAQKGAQIFAGREKAREMARKWAF
jgi:hypothetical protein